MRSTLSNLVIALKTAIADNRRLPRPADPVEAAVIDGVGALQAEALEKAEGLLAGLAYEIEIAQAGALIGLLRLDTPCPIKADAQAKAIRAALLPDGIEATLYAVEINKSRVIAVAQYPR
ncbi:hypothetical protein BAJUN_01700 [Bajunvirus bajun]|uniref:Uncharacterized protein n=1 Tax=Brevundimonas phage vB_BgoS-Bajun TaxID=2948594 RepID=A0A9E7N6C8_9CAUD|nr:hypothetical protein BAJUN_01700 [Brevundimonas phage vB_BgoS-Bajun]